MEFDLDHDYPVGTVMHDYCEAVKEDPTLKWMRVELQALDDALDGDYDIDYDAECAVNKAIHEIRRAMDIQSETLLRDIAEEHAERAVADGGVDVEEP